MSIACKVLAQSALAATNTVLYTVPTGKTAIVKTIAICNTDSADKTVNLWAVASADSEAVKNKILHNLIVLGSETAFINPDLYLSAGYKVIMTASAGSVVGVTITGVEM